VVDGDFDLIGGAFESDVYGSSKGAIRLAVLWADLLRAIPRISQGGLSILDAGGGAGHLAVRLAGLGHRVTLAEPSHEMRERAHAAIRAAEVTGSVTVIPAALRELPDVLHVRFDVIVCHAVLEWLAEPRRGLECLPPLLAPNGQLSLLFYNRNASVLKQILRGEFAVALQELEGSVLPRGWATGCVPIAEEDVRTWLSNDGLAIQSKAGIRIFHDHIVEEVRRQGGLDQLLKLEQACSRQEPFASLAQHIHLVCRRAPPS
jgi:S-adenosylmethionine-dependent methyltransferase